MLVNLLDQGGLCNRLTHAAAFLAASKEFGFPVIHAPLARYKKKLPVVTNNIICLSPYNKFHSVTAFAQTTTSRVVRSCCRKYLKKQSVRNVTSIPTEYSNISLIQEDILNKAKHSLLCFDFGWPTIPQDLAEKHKNTVLQQLQFPTIDSNAVRHEFESIDKRKGDIIGLHIRRGDYQHIKNGQYFWSIEEYKKLIERITKSTGNQVVICSNEPLNLHDWKDLPIYYFQPDQIKDIIRLSLCDYVIGPPSTFSAWAAFMGNKKIAHLEQSDADIKFASPQLMDSLE